MNETPPRLPPEEPRQEEHNPAWGRAQRAWRRTVLPALLLCVAPCRCFWRGGWKTAFCLPLPALAGWARCCAFCAV